ncbi:MAG: aminoacyl-tRNA hydrolase [Candidatus Omnitrophica bacterium]|nr:aminoacyl-tRNA hydrolase [Candidatus Omnitrophota bacterium]
MKLIVGLGNPGIIYSGTRHNVGYSVVKALARSRKAVFKKEPRIQALGVRCGKQGDEVFLALPLTYMNLSGGAVKALMDKYAVPPQDVLAVCDDLNLEFGRLRIRPSGSAGGHKGIASIISVLKSEDFCRLRVGIGRPAGDRKTAAEFVLSAFDRRDKGYLKEALVEACSCAELWVREGIVACMNKYNTKNKS